MAPPTGVRRMSAAGEKGLYPKYEVFKDGERVVDEECFILEPEDDPAARIALAAYADVTDNEALAEDIIEWLTDLGMPANLDFEVLRYDEKTDSDGLSSSPDDWEVLDPDEGDE